MNIVKGVADLIRRTSSGQTDELSSGSQSQRLHPPGPRIRFSELGDEAVLKTLWDKYEKALDKVEKRRAFLVFLKHFLVVYKTWEPENYGQLSESASFLPLAEYSSSSDDIIGCFAAHPAEIIFTLSEEVKQLTTLVTELNAGTTRTTTDFSCPSTSLNITSEGFPVLDALMIVTRSLHNCRVFGYYGGIQKLTALMKGSVVQLKAISGALCADEDLSTFTVEKTSLLQQILLYVVSIIFSFIELNSFAHDKVNLYSNMKDFVTWDGVSAIVSSSNSLKVPSETKISWHQKAVVSLMEAGGLNWLVELLRVIKRLNMKDQRTEYSLHFLTLRILHSALFDNSRGQNHFKSIGGLEVLLDGLGIPVNINQILKNSTSAVENREENTLLNVFRLHVLSLEVLREAVFPNVSNLQFLCENGRVQKFANSFSSPAFMLQEYKLQSLDSSGNNDFQTHIFSSESENQAILEMGEHSEALPASGSYSRLWADYVINLSRVLCSFLLPSEDIRSQHVPAGRTSSLPVASLYGELSVKWVMRVLHTLFPCLKACSNQNEFPIHTRIFMTTLQHHILDAFRKSIVGFPSYLDIFRAEGIWELIFSENFFYFGKANKDVSPNATTDSASPTEGESSLSAKNQTKVYGVDILQMEVISFVELAATSNGTAHNSPEISAMLDALDQSACNPDVANALGKSLLRILQLSAEKTIAAFKSLDAAARFLKVTCLQAQEYKKFGNSSPSVEVDATEMVPDSGQGSTTPETAQSWLQSMETSMELFMEFFSATHDTKSLVLHSSSCVDCLFELFWEEGLRNNVLKYIRELMKIVPFSDEDKKAKLQLCSKYLETFTQIKERDKGFADLSIDLLVGMRDMLMSDPMYYQTLFRDGECFLHVVSLLNGNIDRAGGEKLVLNVFQTLTCLLASNDVSKAVFRSLTGKGYQALQSLLLDFCQWHPSEGLLNALLDMLVDGKFDIKASPLIKNEDAIILYLSVLRKSSESLQQQGLNVFQQLLRDSISNRASCVRAGMLDFLLDWFPHEENDDVVVKISQLIQVIGGHSISGKDIRKIFALLRSEEVGSRHKYCSLLLTTILSMLNEKGPTAFFDFSGKESGIVIKTPIQWPLSKGFSFSCWFRVENFPRHGTMGLFSFLTENGRGSLAVLAKDKLVYESINQKRQCVQLSINLVRKKWHFLCITHSIGRAFSGGSLLKCYVDGELVSSEKCRYAKINESLMNCTIGAKITMAVYEDDIPPESMKDCSAFCGQIGPVYLLNDAISPDQVQGVYSLGPSYMYSFLDNEAIPSNDNFVSRGILDSKDGLASKIIFGINAQASDGRTLFNVSPMLDHVPDRNLFEATVMVGTQICSRSLWQQIIYCVGGVSAFFPLIAQSDKFETEESGQCEHSFHVPITRDRVTAEVIEIIASVLDDNLANQQQMHLLSGFSILGFLLQSVPPQQLNLQTLSALKHLFNVIANCGMAELLVKDAISCIFLNPFIWLYTSYRVQRELYMFLVQQFDNDPRLLKSLCRLPRVLDIIRQFYWDNAKSRLAIGNKPLLHPVTGKVIGERPTNEEVHKIRLLLLSLGEMSLRQNIVAADIKALVAFFETSQDMACIEDVLHMVIRAVSNKQLLSAFLEQVDSLGGCHVFVNLLQREFEPIRLLGLQFLGRLLVGLPSEKKGLRFFNLAVGRPRLLSEGPKKISSRLQPIFSAMTDRLFKFPQTENLCATLFDVLLGGASPKQVLQKYNQDRQRTKGHSCQFFLPQILVLIFRFLIGSDNASSRMKIIHDLLDLLDSTVSNVEAFMEFGWNSWLDASIKLEALKDYGAKSQDHNNNESNEQSFVRSLFCTVLCYYMYSVKGGWQQLEETVNFLLMQFEQDNICHHLLRDIYGDLIHRLVELSSEENIFISQPCRDNTLYLLRLIDELLISEIDHELLFPANSSEFSLDSLEIECHKDHGSVLNEVLQGVSDNQISRNPSSNNLAITNEDRLDDDKWWSIYDNLWIVISEMNGRGPNKVLPKSAPSAGPTFGQRARGLVESLNIPAAEVAAVVVSGGIGNALVGKPIKNVDKAMLLRGERCPRIIFRLVILYLCRSSLEKASRCVQQFISLLPCFLAADDEQSKNRLQLFIWDLLAVRSKYGLLNDGARFHVISHLIRETVKCGKSVLASSIVGRDDSDSSSNSKEAGSIQNLIQKDRVLAAVADEAKYVKTIKTDRTKQLHDLSARIDENISAESHNRQAFEDELQSILSSILVSDEARRAAFQLSYEEEQQNIIEKWIHMFRALTDERGPWSDNQSPSTYIRHWKLDKTEDTWRRRLKLRQNYHFDEKLCHPPSNVLNNNEVALATSDSKPGLASHIPEQMKRFLLKGVRGITDEVFSDSNENDSELSEENSSISKELSDSQSPEQVKESGDRIQEKQDPSTSSSETETSEVVTSVACVLITPKRKLAGHLTVMKNVLHFSGEFLVEGTGGSSVFKNFHASSNIDPTKSDQKQRPVKWPIYLDLYSEKGTIVDNADVIHENVLKRKQLKSVKRHRRWNIGKIKAVHWNRYLLRFTAIEIFFCDSGSPIFLNFASVKEAKDVGNLIVSTRNEYLFPKGSGRDRSSVISFVDRSVALEMAEAARESWRRRDITNFEYLMILNTLAGRSYNDLTQYPVFPWVLADYTSEVLDFNKSSTFRDLSKPVGALDSKRFEVFDERYRSFSDPDIPSFYYGSHYSSMGIVLYYLLRLEPFTSLHRNLQGGKFDHADRLFQGIEGTYRNCLSNTSDVKELIPEFFYMPEFLTNSNSYHFGVKQDGEPISDVCLPPWAKGSPEEFICRNREALESEYVSSNLHHWIDLVFGYKQRGKPAVEAANIFYYLTYEGAVDLETMEDDLQRAAIEDQIANFGQTPIQIFRKKHPRRGPPIPIAHPLYFAPSSINLTSVVPSTRYPSSPVLYVHILDSTIVQVNQGITLSVKVWITTQLQSGGNFTFSGSHDPLFGVGTDTLSSRKIGSPLAESIELGAQCFTTLQTPSENFLISCGNWENSFQVISLNDGRLVQTIRQHKDVVSCVAVTSDGSILATGSFDTTVMVWEVARGRNLEKRGRPTPLELPRKDSVIVETPFHILCGHDDVITCLFVSVDLDIVISGSKDGTCIFHTLREGRYIRSLRQPNGCPLSKLVASQHGRIVFYADDDLSLHLYSINGKYLASSESNGRLNCMELSRCGGFLVCAGDQGQIVVRSMDSLAIIHKYGGVGKVVTSLTVSPEECFLAGTKDGSLLVYSIENPQLRKASGRNPKSKHSAVG